MKKISKLLLLLFFALLFNINAQDAEMDPAAAAAYNEGNQMMKAGNYSGALDKYNTALETTKDYRIYYQKGVTLKKLRKYSEAEDALKAGIELNPDFYLFYNALGGVYFSEGQFQNAAETFKKFAEMSDKPQYKEKANQYVALAYTKLGETAKSDGDYDNARKYLSLAVASSPYDAAYLSLAQIYVETGQYDQALEAADKALNNRNKISRGGPLYYKGMAFKAMGEKEKAIEAFEAGRKDPQYKNLAEYELETLQ